MSVRAWPEEGSMDFSFLCCVSILCGSGGVLQFIYFFLSVL